MATLGRRSWWLPGWLDRIIPKVDIEPASVEPDTRRAAAPLPSI
jgi:putative drug exporter of the RND superfamily